MILELLILFHLKVVFYEGATHCSVPERGQSNGCISYVDKKIYLNYAGTNLNKTLWHEVGHRIFYNDTKVQDIVAPMRGFKQYWRLYKEESITREKVSDYYASYRLNKEWFKTKYTSLYEHFENTELCLSGCYSSLPSCPIYDGLCKRNKCVSKCTIN